MRHFKGKLVTPKTVLYPVVEAEDARDAVRRFMGGGLDLSDVADDARCSLDVEGVVASFYPDEADRIADAVGDEAVDVPFEEAPSRSICLACGGEDGEHDFACPVKITMDLASRALAIGLDQQLRNDVARVLGTSSAQVRNIKANNSDTWDVEWFDGVGQIKKVTLRAVDIWGSYPPAATTDPKRVKTAIERMTGHAWDAVERHPVARGWVAEGLVQNRLVKSVFSDIELESHALGIHYSPAACKLAYAVETQYGVAPPDSAWWPVLVTDGGARYPITGPDNGVDFDFPRTP